MKNQQSLNASKATSQVENPQTNRPAVKVSEWLFEEAEQREGIPSAYGKHDRYSKYSKSFGQYSKS